MRQLMFKNLQNALEYQEAKVDSLKYNSHIGKTGKSQNGLIKNKFRDNLIKNERIISK